MVAIHEPRFSGISLSAAKSVNYQKDEWYENITVTIYDSDCKFIETDEVQFNGRHLGRSPIVQNISDDLKENGKKSMLLNPRSDRPRLSALGKSLLKLALFTMDTANADPRKNYGFANNDPNNSTFKGYRFHWEKFYEAIEKNRMKTLLSPKSPETIAGRVWALQLRG